MNKLIISILRTYKKFVSPVLTAVFGGACRFSPSCSDYTIEACGKFGTMRGIYLGLKRVSRCHPWGGFGYDRVIAHKL